VYKKIRSLGKNKRKNTMGKFMN